MAKESTYPTTSLTEGDYIRIIDDPSGTPLTRNVSTSHALANLNTGSGFSTPTQSGTPPTYTVQASDFGKVLVSNQATTNYFTIPDGLPSNFYFYVYQAGVGSSVIQGNGTSSVVGVTSSGDQLVATGAQKAVIEVRPYGTDTYVCFGSNLAIPPFANSYSMQITGYSNANHAAGSFDFNGWTTFTMACWHRQNVSAGSGHDIAYMGSNNLNNFIVHDTGDQDFDVRINNTDIVIPTTTNLNSDTWKFVAVTFNAGTWKAYDAGVEIGTVTFGPTSFNSTATDTWKIGAASSKGSTGYWDLFGIWNDELSAAELLSLYNSGTPISLAVDVGSYNSSADLAHYYTMGDSNGGTGSTITDVIGSVNLTMAGTAAFSTEVP